MIDTRHPVITRVCGTADMNPGTRSLRTLALRAIQPKPGRWIAQGRPAPKAKRPKPRVTHAAAIPDKWPELPFHGHTSEEWRQARNDRKRMSRARRDK